MPTLFGPFRIWIYPNTFRSSKVKKAMASIINKKIRIVDRMYDIGIITKDKFLFLELKSNALFCHRNVIGGNIFHVLILSQIQYSANLLISYNSLLLVIKVLFSI